MTSFATPRRRSKLPLVIVLFVLVVGAVGGAAIYFAPRFESAAPTIALSADSTALGAAPLEVTLSDAGTGLASFSATLSQNGTDHALANEVFAQPTAEKRLAVALAKVAGIKEGPAVLKIVARDRALFRGNETVLQKNITIDVTAPTIELVADDRYVSFGGVGVIVYRTAADAVSTGIQLGAHFFPGTRGQIKDHPEHVLAMFAQAYDTPADARAKIVATDAAGNTRELALSYDVKDVKYRKSTIALSDAFLQNKIAPLLTDVAARQRPPRELFIAVNRDLRKDNEARITEITRHLTPRLLWQGAFTQLPNSKVEANFADERTYTYNGEPVSVAYHVGYDLSVTKHAPVEASNSGTVVFAGDLGIYGGTVILDHGLGLFSLYSHLSAIDVKEGDTLTHRQILGKTGETGLAAGDHLHFGIYLHGVAVLPVEWWDAKWIADNITPKLQGKSGQEIAEAATPARKGKALKKSGARRR
jgi:murein DD-endopeptidase MepM/ murein hydrolase activator NlpD